ncbi:CCR4-NOT transcription complex subunit 4 isoform X2 [Rhodnius prolixus]|uniref:CCR4-NOT transcription complex subunit 4 isoform X2 n=1 Tax=Rhodnius prolixus TaxID=13249 RepID=UPI003D18F741
MSVLNQSGEEQVECPLCMEPLEVDDLNFFPCTCGYQICRFCWHRIRTDENGLCPACRKTYPENPADFKPLTQEEVAKLKAEKRQKDQQRKQRITENRKHLANVRVVQKNLVFVVGLPLRLADPEMLKKHEYFGKFGKIHKVVINQSTTYAGSQGPSASAYVTYQKSDDALRAIQTVNNIAVDGRTVKTSLGTTKYCSHFMKNQPCPKADCMYLHELGDPEASFTKEEMQQGKHQEYEKKLHEQLLSSSLNRKPTPSPPTVPIPVHQGVNRDAWPSLHTNQHNSSVIVGVPPSSSPESNNLVGNSKNEKRKQNLSKHKNHNSIEDSRKHKEHSISHNRITDQVDSPEIILNHSQHVLTLKEIKNCSSLSDGSEDYLEDQKNHCDSSDQTHNCIKDTVQNHRNNVEFSNHRNNKDHKDVQEFSNYNSEISSSYNNKNKDFSTQRQNPHSATDWKVNGVPEVLSQVRTSDNWHPTFDFTHLREEEPMHYLRDDDLGFDPFHETQKALAEMIEKEEQHRYQPKLLVHHNRLNSCTKLLDGLRLGTAIPHSRPPPPGFTTTPNHMNAFGLGIPRTGWDWPSLDPAIVTSAQHCDLYSGNPPPGFSLRQTLDNL